MAQFDEANGGFYDDTYFASIEARYRTGAHGSRYRNIMSCIGATAGQRILEVGCGSGFFCAQVAQCGAEVVGLDYSPDGIEYGRAHYPEVTLMTGSAYELEALFEAESFDQVLLLDVIEHMSDHATLMSGIRQVLKPQGRLVISTDNEACIWTRPPWSRLYTRLHRLSREGRAYRALKQAESRTPGRTCYHSSHIHCLSTRELQSLLAEHQFSIVEHRTYPLVGVPVRDVLLKLAPWDQRGDHQCLVAVKQPRDE